MKDDVAKEYSKKASTREDAPVIKFLKNLDSSKKYAYLEVGAGLGRFPLKLKNDTDMKNLDITCLEISKELVNELKSKNLKVMEGSIMNAPFENDSFGILHCSHIIEHFGYPNVTKVLDEIFRITKKGGYVVIRSPLMHSNFYNDIDHVRPYPPKTIIQYFNNPQQQKQGSFSIKPIKTWNRKQAKEIQTNIKGSWYINILLKRMWNRFGWPTAKANGYVAIFQKI